MTKEELKKEAEEKAEIYFDSLEVDNGNVSDTRFSDYDVFVAYEKGALDFAEPREKRIKELEEQIEKMKCCEMCKHKNLDWVFSPICEARDKIKIENPLTCKCDKWEIKENDSIRKN